NVVIYVRYFVAEFYDLTFKCFSGSVGVTQDAVNNFACKIKSLTVLFNHLDYSLALLVMPEMVGNKLIQRSLSVMPEGSMSKIVTERYS
ncbi:hypothetical protein OSL60_26355, partial [Escherichia coli]|nr:hypothetical protein [Escherichia coli]